MVLSALYDSKRYYSLHPLFERAFEFYRSSGRFLEEGRHEIDGDNLTLTITECELRSVDEAYLEAHNNYIDIQIVMQGIESYGVADRVRCEKIREKYDSKRDIEFYNDNFENSVKLSVDDFVIFFPEDAHAPLIGTGKIKKAIFKIKK